MHTYIHTYAGSTYERVAIEMWLKAHSTSPVTNEPLSNQYTAPNNMARSLIRQFVDDYPHMPECIDFLDKLGKERQRL